VFISITADGLLKGFIDAQFIFSEKSDASLPNYLETLAVLFAAVGVKLLEVLADPHGFIEGASIIFVCVFVHWFLVQRPDPQCDIHADCE
jgi:hypothetical protein